MHLNPSPEDAKDVIAAGWGEDHFLVTLGKMAQRL
eukprot:CAMPEP_0114526800 /NCGR_PEP_ID=MMETSP0109-20121206/23240_1 /TAXON_ID=29199 /ORGANISM="Chlorarachnion reptans, Strain CCCM449" /LENGTH=34 /DNA_ID= /DNA_START= /DNA_END= /DNA_ORIENTATION=